MSELEKNQNEGSAISRIHINEIVKNVKELKELIPSESIFEKVLNIFVKKQP